MYFSSNKFNRIISKEETLTIRLISKCLIADTSSNTYGNFLLDNDAEISRNQDLSPPTHNYQSETCINKYETTQNQEANNNLVAPTNMSYNPESENTAIKFTDFTQSNIETNAISHDLFLYPDKNNDEEDNFDTSAASSTAAADLVVAPSVATEQSNDLDTNGDNCENNSMDMEIEENHSSKIDSSSNQNKTEEFILLTDKNESIKILEETEVITNDRTLNDDEIYAEPESADKANETTLNNLDNIIKTIIAPIGEDAQQRYYLNQNFESQIQCKEKPEKEGAQMTEVALPNANNKNFKNTLNQNLAKDIPNQEDIELSLKTTESKKFIPKIIIKATKITDDGTAQYFIKKPKLCDVADQHHKEQNLKFTEKNSNDNAKDVIQSEVSPPNDNFKEQDDSISYQEVENCNVENARAEDGNDNTAADVVATNNCEIPAIQEENHESNASSSSSHDSNTNIKREFEGIIINSTSKGDKTQRSTPKVFSILEVSFASASQDDDEFIRRTLKSYAKTEENVDLHGKTCNEPTEISCKY